MALFSLHRLYYYFLLLPSIVLVTRAVGVAPAAPTTHQGRTVDGNGDQEVHHGEPEVLDDEPPEAEAQQQRFAERMRLLRELEANRESGLDDAMASLALGTPSPNYQRQLTTSSSQGSQESQSSHGSNNSLVTGTTDESYTLTSSHLTHTNSSGGLIGRTGYLQRAAASNSGDPNLSGSIISEACESSSNHGSVGGTCTIASGGLNGTGWVQLPNYQGASTPTSGSAAPHALTTDSHGEQHRGLGSGIRLDEVEEADGRYFPAGYKELPQASSSGSSGMLGVSPLDQQRTGKELTVDTFAIGTPSDVRSEAGSAPGSSRVLNSQDSLLGGYEEINPLSLVMEYNSDQDPLVMSGESLGQQSGRSHVSHTSHVSDVFDTNLELPRTASGNFAITNAMSRSGSGNFENDTPSKSSHSSGFYSATDFNEEQMRTGSKQRESTPDPHSSPQRLVPSLVLPRGIGLRQNTAASAVNSFINDNPHYRLFDDSSSQNLLTEAHIQTFMLNRSRRPASTAQIGIPTTASPNTAVKKPSLKGKQGGHGSKTRSRSASSAGSARSRDRSRSRSSSVDSNRRGGKSLRERTKKSDSKSGKSERRDSAHGRRSQASTSAQKRRGINVYLGGSGTSATGGSSGQLSAINRNAQLLLSKERGEPSSTHGKDPQQRIFLSFGRKQSTAPVEHYSLNSVASPGQSGDSTSTVPYWGSGGLGNQVNESARAAAEGGFDPAALPSTSILHPHNFLGGHSHGLGGTFSTTGSGWGWNQSKETNKRGHPALPHVNWEVVEDGMAKIRLASMKPSEPVKQTYVERKQQDLSKISHKEASGALLKVILLAGLSHLFAYKVVNPILRKLSARLIEFFMSESGTNLYKSIPLFNWGIPLGYAGRVDVPKLMAQSSAHITDRVADSVSVPLVVALGNFLTNQMRVRTSYLARRKEIDKARMNGWNRLTEKLGAPRDQDFTSDAGSSASNSPEKAASEQSFHSAHEHPIPGGEREVPNSPGYSTDIPLKTTQVGILNVNPEEVDLSGLEITDLLLESKCVSGGWGKLHHLLRAAKRIPDIEDPSLSKVGGRVVLGLFLRTFLFGPSCHGDKGIDQMWKSEEADAVRASSHYAHTKVQLQRSINATAMAKKGRFSEGSSSGSSTGSKQSASTQQTITSMSSELGSTGAHSTGSGAVNKRLQPYLTDVVPVPEADTILLSDLRKNDPESYTLLEETSLKISKRFLLQSLKSDFLLGMLDGVFATTPGPFTRLPQEDFLRLMYDQEGAFFKIAKTLIMVALMRFHLTSASQQFDGIFDGVSLKEKLQDLTESAKKKLQNGRQEALEIGMECLGCGTEVVNALVDHTRHKSKEFLGVLKESPPVAKMKQFSDSLQQFLVNMQEVATQALGGDGQNDSDDEEVAHFSNQIGLDILGRELGGPVDDRFANRHKATQTHSYSSTPFFPQAERDRTLAFFDPGKERREYPVLPASQYLGTDGFLEERGFGRQDSTGSAGEMITPTNVRSTLPRTSVTGHAGEPYLARKEVVGAGKGSGRPADVFKPVNAEAFIEE